MPSLFIYLIKANIALVLFYLAYHFVLRRLTFYTLNRYFLLLGIGFSAIFPLVDINTFFRYGEQTGSTYYAFDWQALQSPIIQPDTFTVWTLLQYVFWTGVAIMAIRFIIQLLSLWKIQLQAVSGKVKKEKVKIMSGKINPFSFFRNIYINPALYSPGELDTILAHEKIHIKGWHSLDVLAGEINNIFYWFNPGAWLMKTAIRENLEFITDQKLVHSGINIKDYQYNLLKSAGVLRSARLANNFKLSHLKRRIMMMNKKSSSRRHLFRYLFLIPTVATIVFFLTSSGKQELYKEGNHPPAAKVKTSGTIGSLSKSNITLKIKTDSQPKSKKAKTSLGYQIFLDRNPSVKRVVWSRSVDKLSTIIIIHLKNVKKERYDLNNADDLKKVKAKYGRLPNPPAAPPPPPPAPSHSEKEQDSYHNRTGTGSQKSRDTAALPADVLYIVNGKKVKNNILSSLNPADIASISVNKRKSAFLKYGEAAKNGVVKIYTKDFVKNHPKEYRKDTSNFQVQNNGNN